MNKWIRTENYKLPKAQISGIYSAVTESGRKIYSFSNSAEDAYTHLIPGVNYSDKILYISREIIHEH
jgi:hypothetical protein